jgi:hypothetical protein
VKVKIELVSNQDKTLNSLVFTSSEALSEEQLLEVLVNWLNEIWGNNAEQINVEQRNPDQK